MLGRCVNLYSKPSETYCRSGVKLLLAVIDYYLKKKSCFALWLFLSIVIHWVLHFFACSWQRVAYFLFLWCVSVLPQTSHIPPWNKVARRFCNAVTVDHFDLHFVVNSSCKCKRVARTSLYCSSVLAGICPAEVSCQQGPESLDPDLLTW